ncbi:HEAT repeat domain-containing protein [Candidatus Micrarchaeota archaeon]|nr:HEAT repeat domain-containing protein [Candidatus Micrarchaeota archaeon]
MPKEAFGGDDDSSGLPPQETKKLKLDKFGLSPDTNIRDVFWKIIGSYATTKKPGLELKDLDEDRFALMNAARSVLSSPHNNSYGISERFLVNYCLMMMLDANWIDALAEFFDKAYSDRNKGNVLRKVVLCLRKLLLHEQYRAQIEECLKELLRNNSTNGMALTYLSQIEDKKLVEVMKKELIIIARGDIGENQINAIEALGVLKEDEEVWKSLIMLLSHWDEQARLSAAIVLKEIKGNEEVKSAAAKRLESETDPEIRKILGKILGKVAK